MWYLYETGHTVTPSYGMHLKRGHLVMGTDAYCCDPLYRPTIRPDRLDYQKPIPPLPPQTPRHNILDLSPSSMVHHAWTKATIPHWLYWIHAAREMEDVSNATPEVGSGQLSWYGVGGGLPSNQPWGWLHPHCPMRKTQKTGDGLHRQPGRHDPGPPHDRNWVRHTQTPAASYIEHQWYTQRTVNKPVQFFRFPRHCAIITFVIDQ